VAVCCFRFGWVPVRFLSDAQRGELAGFPREDHGLVDLFDKLLADMNAKARRRLGDYR